jgi:hypothetical protein
MVAVACTPERVGPLDPSIVGVVIRREFVGSRTARFSLETGKEVEIDLEKVDRLVPGGAEPDVGDLLLYGVAGTDAWLVTIRSGSNGFELRTTPAAARSGSIVFDFGLRLPIADNYHETGGPMEEGTPATYVVNQRGEVTERR